MAAIQLDERALFEVARQLASGDAREAFLQQICADDARVGHRVRNLLGAYEASASFLEAPAAPEAGTIDSPAPAEAAGTLVGPYKLLQQIGEGGMGTVFMAEQTRPVQRKVAVKVIKAGMDSRQIIARFEAERQALAMMDHVNIARVLDAGATDRGRPYFVMELVHGVPITKYCDDHHLTPRQRLELFVPVCQAIQHAHQKGVIHRDIKPSNVMVTLYDGRPVPKVIDFGVAKATEQKLTERTLFTQYGTMVGTLEYMSPEQAEMSGLGVDTRSDIYSLGVLLYELLTGSTPLFHQRVQEAAYAEVLRMIKEEEPPKPSTRLSESMDSLPAISARRHMEPGKLTRLVRGELDWIVMKCLEKDRNRRYETVNGFAADVQRYLKDEPVQACPPSPWYRVRKLVRRHKRAVLAAALVVLALVGGMVGTTWGLIRATDARADAADEAGRKEEALAAAQASERDAQEQLFQALLSRARAGRFSRQTGQRLDSLDALARAARIRPDERLRDEATAAMALPDIRPGPGWDAAGTVWAWAFDASYRLSARDDEHGVITVRSVPDYREVRRIESGLGGRSALWLSPDGAFLAQLAAGGTLRVWRVADGRPALGDVPGQCLCVTFSPDGWQLAVGLGDGWLLRFDLATGREANRVRLPAAPYDLAFHPDSRRLAVGYGRRDVASVYATDDARPPIDLPVGLMSGQVVAWHPDGERLAVAGSSPAIQVWDVTARRRLSTLEGHVEQVTVLSFHPDGELLVSNSWDAVARLWHVGSGRELLRLPVALTARFSGDGRWLGVAWHGERAQLLELVPTEEYRTFATSPGTGPGAPAPQLADISPDGRVLAATMQDATRLWDLSTGRELAALPGPAHRVLFGRDPRRPELFVGDSTALQRWPLTPRFAAAAPAGRHESAGTELVLGPPRPLLPTPLAEFVLGPDGRTMLVGDRAGPLRVVDLERGVVEREWGEHALMDRLAVSRDGRWAATTGWHSGRVRVWDARTGALAHEWADGQAQVAFTPDSRALVTSSGDAYRFWDAGTWEGTRRLRRDVALYAGPVAFSPDGRLMALEMAPAVIHLKEVETGRTVARLEDPTGDRVSTWLGFTPDGTRLVVLAGYARVVHVWDLRAIRVRLTAMGLDWDWPAFPPAARAGDPAPVRIEVVSGAAHYQRGVNLARAGRAGEAVAEFRHSLRLEPDQPRTKSALAHSLNNHAWELATHPESGRRAPGRAVELAREAVDLQPTAGTYWNTLGAAHYRAGSWKDAVTALHKSMGLRSGGDGSDWFFLAMAHWRQGDKDEARKWHDRAVAWTDKNRPESDELRRFRAEAADLLGLAK